MAAQHIEVDALTNKVAEVVLEEGKEVFIFDEASTETSALDLRWTLAGRFLTERQIQLDPMSQVLAAAWRPGNGVSITEHSLGLFLFQFGHEADIQRVMEGGPWSYEN